MASAFDYLPIILASQQADRANQAAAEQTRKENERWDYFKAQDEKDRAALQPIIDSYKSMMEENKTNAAKDRARYDAVAIPLQDRMVAEANAFSSPERKMLEIGKATALVSNQMEGQRKASIRNLESFGIDPSAARYGALDANMRALTGASQAAAGNQASQWVDNTAQSLRANAANMLSGLPAQSMSGYGTAMNAGSGVSGNTFGLTNTAASTLGTPMQYGALSNQALGNATQALGVMNQGYGSYYGNQNTGGGSGWGSMLGFLGGSLLSNRGLFSGGAGAGAADAAGAAAASPGLWSSLASAGTSAMAMLAEGGAIPAHTSPTAGAAVDDVPARLTVGEFVMPKDVTAWKGEEFFQKLIEQSRKAKDQATAKPEIGVAPQEPPTFVSRPQGGALPVG